MRGWREKPACTLLHLGPGLANSLANLHNASRARVPIINLVGQHATYHLRYVKHSARLRYRGDRQAIFQMVKNVSGYLNWARCDRSSAGGTHAPG